MFFLQHNATSKRFGGKAPAHNRNTPLDLSTEEGNSEKDEEDSTEDSNSDSGENSEKENSEVDSDEEGKSEKSYPIENPSASAKARFNLEAGRKQKAAHRQKMIDVDGDSDSVDVQEDSSPSPLPPVKQPTPPSSQDKNKSSGARASNTKKHAVSVSSQVCILLAHMNAELNLLQNLDDDIVVPSTPDSQLPQTPLVSSHTQSTALQRSEGIYI